MYTDYHASKSPKTHAHNSEKGKISMIAFPRQEGLENSSALLLAHLWILELFHSHSKERRRRWSQWCAQ